MSITRSPWTAEQVEALNYYQADRRFHAFTCGGSRGDEAHQRYALEHGEDMGQLIATQDGWVCPVCDYTQDWVHDFMAAPRKAAGS